MHRESDNHWWLIKRTKLSRSQCPHAITIIETLNIHEDDMIKYFTMYWAGRLGTSALFGNYVRQGSIGKTRFVTVFDPTKLNAAPEANSIITPESTFNVLRATRSLSSLERLKNEILVQCTEPGLAIEPSTSVNPHITSNQYLDMLEDSSKGDEPLRHFYQEGGNPLQNFLLDNDTLPHSIVSTSINPLTAKTDVDATTSPPSINIIIEPSPCKKQRKGRTIPSPPKSFHNTLHEPKYSPGVDMKNAERITRGRRSLTGFVKKSVDNNKKKLEIVESEVMELRKRRKREQRVDRRLQDISRAAPTAGELIRQAAYTLGGHTLSNKDKVKRIVNETLKEFHLKSLPDSIIRPHVNKVFSPWQIGKTRRWHYIHHIIYICLIDYVL